MDKEYNRKLSVQEFKTVITQTDNTFIKLYQDSSEQKTVRKQIKMTPTNKQYVNNERQCMQQVKSDFVVPLLESFIQIKDSKRVMSLCMPYYKNGNLDNYLPQQVLKFNSSMKIFVQLLVGLSKIHSEFIIHRDLKLKNILIDKEENQNIKVVIADFGAAIQTLDPIFQRIGTIGYQAPESIYPDENGYDDKVDMFSLGLIALQIFNSELEHKKIQNRYSILKPEVIKNSMLVDESQPIGLKIEAYTQYINRILIFDRKIPKEIKDLIGRMVKTSPKKRIGWLEMYKLELWKNYYDDYPQLKDLESVYQRIEDKRLILQQRVKCFNYIYTKLVIKMQQYEKKNSIPKQILFEFKHFQCLVFEKMLHTINQFKKIGLFSVLRNLKRQYRHIDEQYDSLSPKITHYFKNNKAKCIPANKLESTFQQYFNKILKYMSITEHDQQKMTAMLKNLSEHILK